MQRLERAAPLAFLLAVAAWYTWVNLGRLAHYEPIEWDLAIFGQGVWLLSRGETPFVTVRGLNLLGEHATFVHLPIAAAYRLLGPLADARFLVLTQSAALAWAGFLLHARARREVGNGAALLVLAAYLLYPPLVYTWGEFYQPLALALGPLVLAFEAVREGRERRAILWSLLALSCMENVAATTAALGLYALALGRRRLGVTLFVGSAVYVAWLLRLWFPWLNQGTGYAYADRLYGDFASSLPEAIVHLAHPLRLLERLATGQNAEYLLGLFLPVAFLPLGAPAALAAAAQLPLNLVSSWPYAHQIRHHYVVLVVPFVFLSLVACLARSPRGSRARRLACGALLVGVAAGQMLYAPAWLASRGDPQRRREVEALLRRIPRGLPLSAHYAFLPRLCERRRLFKFPELGGAAVAVVDASVARHIPAEAAGLRALEAAGFREALRTSGDVVLYVSGNATWLDATTPLLPEEPSKAPPPAMPPAPPPPSR
ncbi:MAG TPA: DUF2079 domain-containing protein [Vicinamibacteria bacterium]|nr:DUF2079 domain-containing protein [Vicinamibacteria bacterium]